MYETIPLSVVVWVLQGSTVDTSSLLIQTDLQRLARPFSTSHHHFNSQQLSSSCFLCSALGIGCISYTDIENLISLLMTSCALIHAGQQAHGPALWRKVLIILVQQSRNAKYSIDFSANLQLQYSQGLKFIWPEQAVSSSSGRSILYIHIYKLFTPIRTAHFFWCLFFFFFLLCAHCWASFE